MHQCSTFQEWIRDHHYMCPCGHVEWAHYGERLAKTECAHCNCRRYRGETRPLTEFELQHGQQPSLQPSPRLPKEG